MINGINEKMLECVNDFLSTFDDLRVEFYIFLFDDEEWDNDNDNELRQ